MSSEKTIFWNDCCTSACKIDTSTAAFCPTNSGVVLTESAMLTPFDHPFNGTDASDEATNDITEASPEYNLHSEDAASCEIEKDFPSNSY
mmetsp:Transcript_5011/g.11457  ORF Transcript_5011/g.11457 Transcript_5011/m.11457 type:complete len:90 (+) Transcript_5011:113-382(+)